MLQITLSMRREEASWHKQGQSKVKMNVQIRANENSVPQKKYNNYTRGDIIYLDTKLSCTLSMDSAHSPSTIPQQPAAPCNWHGW